MPDKDKNKKNIGLTLYCESQLVEDVLIALHDNPDFDISHMKMGRTACSRTRISQIMLTPEDLLRRLRR